MSAVASMLAVIPATGRAQGAVGGQVSIVERAGETTTDLNNTVIFLEPALPSKGKAREVKTEIALQSRQFQPRVRVVPVGSKVEFPNEDPFSHNVFSSAEKNTFDLGLYGKGTKKDATFKQSGVIPVYCNIHNRMVAFIVALETPYFTQAGIDGRFSIPAVPAGKYTLHVWHERAPDQTRELVVAATGNDGVNVQLDARRYKFIAHKNKFGQEYKSLSGDRY